MYQTMLKSFRKSKNYFRVKRICHFKIIAFNSNIKSAINAASVHPFTLYTVNNLQQHP